MVRISIFTCLMYLFSWLIMFSHWSQLITWTRFRNNLLVAWLRNYQWSSRLFLWSSWTACIYHWLDRDLTTTSWWTQPDRTKARCSGRKTAWSQLERPRLGVQHGATTRDAIVGKCGEDEHPFTSIYQLDVVLAHGSQRLISQWLPQILQVYASLALGGWNLFCLR